MNFIDWNQALVLLLDLTKDLISDAMTHSLYRYILQKIGVWSHIIFDLMLKIVSAEWAFSLHAEPIFGTLRVEVVFYVTWKNYYIIFLCKHGQTDGAVGHVAVFPFVFLESWLIQALDEPQKRQFSIFLTSLGQSYLYFADLVLKLSPSWSLSYYMSY